ncbi:alpha/beta hydrolase [Nocardioides sp.]|uniref:alpha/beta fold hydrolase n=1 Tax=Nocardioides sp. TaxID=35761 RepID=UPI002B26768D|nr:alpha/beta hydrolase [Nocardioides sp.]
MSTDLSLQTTEPRTASVRVRGGDLAVGVWGPEDPSAPVVLAIHGITATHRGWPLVAAGLPHCRVIAPDLRGRGRSADLPAPYGLARHAEDLEAVLDHFGVESAVVVGHSMGAFVAVALADRIGTRASALVLVDGGLELTPPPGFVPRPDATPEEVLGPAAARLTMSFESHEAYRDFWRAHPAFAGQWNPTVEGYVDYDLRGEAPDLRPSTKVEAVASDSSQLFGGHVLDGRSYADALRTLAVPTTFLRAPRGLMDEPQALYPPDAARTARALVPHLVDVEVEDVNHYTIVMAEPGARVVAEVTIDLLGGTT